MKKIWSYLAVGFAFFSAGLIVMQKVIGDTVKVGVRTIKNKRTSGNNSVVIPIEVETSQKQPKKSRKERKLDRQAKKD